MVGPGGAPNPEAQRELEEEASLTAPPGVEPEEPEAPVAPAGNQPASAEEPPEAGPPAENRPSLWNRFREGFRLRRERLGEHNVRRAAEQEKINQIRAILEGRPRDYKELIDLLEGSTFAEVHRAEMEIKHGAGPIGRLRQWLSGESSVYVDQQGEVRVNHLSDITRRVLTSALNRRTLGGLAAMGLVGWWTGGLGAVAYGSLSGLAGGRFLAEMLDLRRGGTAHRRKELVEAKAGRYQAMGESARELSGLGAEELPEDKLVERRHQLATEMVNLFYDKAVSDNGKLVAERVSQAYQNLENSEKRLGRLREWLGAAGSLAGGGIGARLEFLQGQFEHVDLDLWGKVKGQDFGHQVLTDQNGALKFLYNSTEEGLRNIDMSQFGQPDGLPNLVETMSQRLITGVAMPKENLPTVLAYLMAEKGLSITAGAWATQLIDGLGAGRSKAVAKENVALSDVAHRQALTSVDQEKQRWQDAYEQAASNEWQRLEELAGGLAYLPKRPENLLEGWYNASPKQLKNFRLSDLPQWLEMDEAGQAKVDEQGQTRSVWVGDILWNKFERRWDIILVHNAQLGTKEGLQPNRMSVEEFITRYKPGPLTGFHQPGEAPLPEQPETEEGGTVADDGTTKTEETRAAGLRLNEGTEIEPIKAAASIEEEGLTGYSEEEATKQAVALDKELDKNPQLRNLSRHVINIAWGKDKSGKAILVPKPQRITLGGLQVAVWVDQAIWRAIRQKHRNLPQGETAQELLDLEITKPALWEIRSSTEGSEPRYRVVLETKPLGE